ncbi:cyclin-like protein [Nitzschia inconspicua]|uniref:Cyclin-like protein n=1 Tax=Nitzschia inconspicua TaxID=303405 RepID=A0A9K3M2B2_9STRA|nr:cyclin-like protein [Nitzschia inconspicua]KAG7371646.1 cyclin-like protein [Nitzschia inconspicua]
MLQQEKRYDGGHASSSLPSLSPTTKWPCSYPSSSLHFRTQISPWIVKVSGAFDLVQPSDDNTTTTLAFTILNCLDRFVVETQINTPEQYRLAALTCLYTCIKVHCRKSLSVQVVAQQLSQNGFSEIQVLDMERHVLEVLQWKVHPPSPMEFVQLFLRGLAHDPNEQCPIIDTATLQDLCRCQLEHALHDYVTFGRYRSSQITLAVLLNAMECCSSCSQHGTDQRTSLEQQRQLLEGFLATHLFVQDSSTSDAFQLLRNQLYTALDQNSDHPAVRKRARSSSSSSSSNRGISVLRDSSRLGNQSDDTMGAGTETGQDGHEIKNDNGVGEKKTTTRSQATSPCTVSDNAVLMLINAYH